jgi:hypothetical protein
MFSPAPVCYLLPMRVRGEEWISSLMAAVGIIWSVNVVVHSPLPAYGMVFPPGPLETCAIAILVWLHAKWKRFDRHRQRVSVFSYLD